MNSAYLSNILRDKLSKMHSYYDQSECLIFTDSNNPGPGYHSRLIGVRHPIMPSVEYVAAILCAGDRPYYERANRVLERIAGLQDTAAGSETFGLWPYYMEEKLENMLAPDYNWADFVGKNLICILKSHSDKLEPDLAERLKITLRNAMLCSMKRNVSPDYTNISLMGAFVAVAGGELLGDKGFLDYGIKRLRKLREYTRFNGAFSEYNSSSYTLLAIEEISRMIEYFEDAECLEIAKELNNYAWDCLATHYHTKLKQLSPPQMRCYRDFDGGLIDWFIYISTDGELGSAEGQGSAGISWLITPMNCPERYRKLLREEYKERWIKKAFYKHNQIRSADEEQVIIKDLDSPDLTACTYMAEDYAMGAFEKTDLWNQRRTSMIYWNDGAGVNFLRLRCIKNDYDFCSGMVYTAQYKNIMLSNTGFVNDHGDYHYILDPIKDGKISAKRLLFRFEVSDGVKLRQDGDSFVISGGGVPIRLKLFRCVFDGKDMQVVLNKKGLDLICFDGEERTVDFNLLKECYCVFSLTAGYNGSYSVIWEVEDGYVKSELKAEGLALSVKSPVYPSKFNIVVRTSKIVSQKRDL